MKIILSLPLLFQSVLRPDSADTLSSAKIVVRASRAVETIVVDGFLSEQVWKEGTPFTNFLQRDPKQGEPATEKTEVRVAYDQDALYVGARMYDSRPDSIVARLSRRDNFPNTDGFGVFIDPYYDRRSGYIFAVSPAGSIIDAVMYNDDWDDVSWDGVWEVKTRIDETGWTAEIKIPYSQLRFQEKETYLWGVNFRRDISRKNEQDYLVYTPKNSSGFVSRFADLMGIEGIHPARQVEVLPYATSKAEYTHPPDGNPFNNGSRYLPGGGTDLKIGLATNLTLDATMNPDFGQVEVDPAVVNLSDVESFFEEKRPFFIEGANIFNFGRGGASNYWNFNYPFLTQFYSRRIGRTPQGTLPSADFADVPLGTRILGAVKLTGKPGEGWNVGTIHATTGREFASIQSNGVRSRAEVEPLTYYGVARVQKEFPEGRQGLGMMATAAERNFSDIRLRDEINSRALFTGIDGWTFFDSDKVWVITGWVGMSNVQGNRTRMIQLQRNSQHYFQRPDVRQVKVDSSATSLTGFAGRFWINKQKGNFFFNSALGVIDPKFELNDVGFLGRTDVVNMHVGGGYSWTEPGEIARRAELGGAVFRNYDFDGDVTSAGVFHFGFVQFLNYYQIEWNAAYNPETISNRQTRGGPLMVTPPAYQINGSLSSDDRKEWVFGADMNSYSTRGGDFRSLSAEVEWKPGPNVSVSVGPEFDLNADNAQYVGSYDDPTATATYGARYVFGELTQRTLSANMRLNWTFTPTLSVQIYLQPLISSAGYRNLKGLARSRSYDFLVYGRGASSISDTTLSNGSKVYRVDADGVGSAPPFTFSDPSFNRKELRGNAVFRWEYSPGSTLYLVWTQSRYDWENMGDFHFNHSVRRIFDTAPDNIFLVKLTYWMNL